MILKERCNKFTRGYLHNLIFLHVHYKCVNTGRYQAGWCSSSAVDLYLGGSCLNLGWDISILRFICLSSFPPGNFQDGPSFSIRLFPSGTLAFHHSPDMLSVTLCSQWYWLNYQTAKRSHWKVASLKSCFRCVVMTRLTVSVMEQCASFLSVIIFYQGRVSQICHVIPHQLVPMPSLGLPSGYLFWCLFPNILTLLIWPFFSYCFS